MTDKEKERLLHMPTSKFVLEYCKGMSMSEIEKLLNELQEYWEQNTKPTGK